jgi:hypothetical protein
MLYDYLKDLRLGDLFSDHVMRFNSSQDWTSQYVSTLNSYRHGREWWTTEHFVFQFVLKSDSATCLDMLKKFYKEFFNF